MSALSFERLTLLSFFAVGAVERDLDFRCQVADSDVDPAGRGRIDSVIVDWRRPCRPSWRRSALPLASSASSAALVAAVVVGCGREITVVDGYGVIGVLLALAFVAGFDRQIERSAVEQEPAFEDVGAVLRETDALEFFAVGAVEGHFDLCGQAADADEDLAGAVRIDPVIVNRVAHADPVRSGAVSVLVEGSFAALSRLLSSDAAGK